MRTLVFLLLLVISARLLAQSPKFERQTIDGDIQIGYGIALGRVDADEKTDIVLADKNEIAWYQNPGNAGKPWTKHVIARNLTSRDNVCVAARDITGDGLVEIAVGANWNPRDTVNVDASGACFYLQRPADPTKPWKPIPLEPHEPTTHRMHWLETEDGQMVLAVLPLHGVGNERNAGKTVQVSMFGIEDNAPKYLGKVDANMHATHNFDVITDPEFGDTEFMLIAGKEGYAIAGVNGDSIIFLDNSQSKGAGEVRRYPVGERVLVSIEPMHGTDVVLYREAGPDNWEKTILDQTLNGGHALAAGNLFGSETPEVVAGWRNPDAQGKTGIRCYSKTSDGWKSHTVDDNTIACEDLKLADLNGDGKLDIIGAGRGSKNVVVYWNRSN